MFSSPGSSVHHGVSWEIWRAQEVRGLLVGGFESSSNCSCSSATKSQAVASKHSIFCCVAVFELLMNPVVIPWGLQGSL